LNPRGSAKVEPLDIQSQMGESHEAADDRISQRKLKDPLVRSNGESREDLAKDNSARAGKSKPDGDSQDARDVGGLVVA
jgi:hypothetical protein